MPRFSYEGGCPATYISKENPGCQPYLGVGLLALTFPQSPAATQEGSWDTAGSPCTQGGGEVQPTATHPGFRTHP